MKRLEHESTRMITNLHEWETQSIVLFVRIRADSCAFVFYQFFAFSLCASVPHLWLILLLFSSCVANVKEQHRRGDDRPPEDRAAQPFVFVALVRGQSEAVARPD